MSKRDRFNLHEQNPVCQINTGNAALSFYQIILYHFQKLPDLETYFKLRDRDKDGLRPRPRPRERAKTKTETTKNRSLDRCRLQNQSRDLQPW